jgi:hypothetical protein
VRLYKTIALGANDAAVATTEEGSIFETSEFGSQLMYPISDDVRLAADEGSANLRDPE